MTSTTAYIYDAVRTPRSKGKKDGSLHEVKPVALGAGLLRELQARHSLDTSRVDDVLMGCVMPTGEQGGDIAKTIVQFSDWDESVAGVQLDRFSAGEEIDRTDARLGTPAHALVVASAHGFDASMLKTPEEILMNMPANPEDPDIRADMVFYETANGGAVFSTGSIAWAGSLCQNDYHNDVSRITRNVVMRFLDPTPFEMP